ncbi:response regulator transcription factor [Zoogloea sp.]|jgi:FixJ family two-component response regulator|uniref:response regulator transcription factor n=1 Tax=Zoogloea sp. TaxID=49181 RepID=UPI0035AE5425
MTDSLTVFIVDDDPSVRDALGLLLAVHDHRLALFADAASFLQALKPHWRGCLLLDIRMPGMDGLTLQRQLLEQGCELPVVVMTGHGDVDSARAAFRAMAVDFLEKPLDEARLLAAIDEAFARQRQAVDAASRRSAARLRLEALTPREREVMDHVVAGRHNREIAAALAISPRTVEVHKARMMDKLGVGSVAELVRLSLS